METKNVLHFCIKLLIFICFITIITILTVHRDRVSLAESERRGTLYLHFLEPSIRLDFRNLNRATWNYYSNPSEETMELYLAEVVKFNKYMRQIKSEIQTYPWPRFTNSTVRRTFEIIENLRVFSLSCPENLKWLAKFEIEAEHAEHHGTKLGTCNPNPDLARFLEILREDGGGIQKALRAQFEMPGEFIKSMIDKIWTEIQPIFKQIQVKRKECAVGRILGSATLDASKNADQTNLTNINGKLKELYENVEQFFHSRLGWPLGTPYFWDKSAFWNLSENEDLCLDKLICNFGKKDSCLINACQNSVPSLKHFKKIIFQLFLAKYYQMASAQGYLPLRGLGSDLLPRAIAEAFGIIASKPQYLQKIGFTRKMANETLFIEAIEFIPKFGTYMSQMHWISDLLEKKVNIRNSNRHYWDLRNSFEGVTPNNDKNSTNQNLNLIPACARPGLEDAMNFLVQILKFQIHAALCRLAGYASSEPIHLCDFTEGPQFPNVRKLLIKVMKTGSERHWTEILFEITGQHEIRANAMLEYFKPLQQTLEFGSESIDLSLNCVNS